MKKVTTESDSNHNHLEKMTTKELLERINQEDFSVAESVSNCLPEIGVLIDATFAALKQGGRLFYIGSGTSGRLGILDASECPPTFGVEHGVVIGIIAGGDTAIRKAVEFAEDDTKQGWKDLQSYNITDKDIVVGISASGKTPYVLGAVKECKSQGISTGSISCNENSELASITDFGIDCVVGPEFVTGSTRMKSGTAQKFILNMITTSVMIKLGKIRGNKMVDMHLSNDKLVDRGIRMLQEITLLPADECERLLSEHGSVRKALEVLRKE
jgi:N-acetylmuramic acid 6-phosphate etherase